MILKSSRMTWEVLRVFRTLEEAENFVINFTKLAPKGVDDIRIKGL